MDKHMEVMINRYGMVAAPAAPQMFGNAGREHMEKYGKCQKYECYGCILRCVHDITILYRCLCQCFNFFKVQNQNTLLKLPGKTTSIPPIIRKSQFIKMDYCS